MSGSENSFSDNELVQLVESWCNGACSDEEFMRLEQQLSNDPAARRFYRRYMNLDAALRAAGEATDSAWNDAVPSGGREDERTSRPLRRLMAGMTMAVAIVLIAFILRDGQNLAQGQSVPIGKLRQLHGSVTIAAAGGEVRTAVEGGDILSGDTLRTHEPLSTVNLDYPDGSQLALVGQSTMTCSASDWKGIMLHRGTLFANVTPQPAGLPMRIVTPSDSLLVPGTRFVLDATESQTDMSVREGNVRLTRLNDQRSIDVPAGQRVVSSAAEIVVDAIPATPDEWGEDFEDGLPDGWEQGRFLTLDGPADSHGAVQAVRVPSENSDLFNIATQAQWTSGLFAVGESTHLHITMKMKSPGWFNIFILTKTADETSPAFAGNYLFDQPVWSTQPADEWGTISIPLSMFRPLPPGRDGFKDAVPFQLLFSSPDRDRGLVIDRIRVTSDGPGIVEARPIP